MELSLENLLSELNKIPGGLAKNKTLDDIATKHGIKLKELEKQLEKGIKVEAEHTTDKAIAREIAMDHLFEDPKYYDKLSKIEEGTCGYNADVKTGKEFTTPGGIKMKKDPYGLSAFAIELVKEFNNEVNEVGELSVPPYPYTERSNDLELEGTEMFGTVTYDFSAGDNFYDVIFEYDYDSELGKNIVKVDFTANESYEMTNTNEPYKIMATVFSIIKEELAKDIVKDNLDILLYTPAETKTKGSEATRLRGINQRNELYKAFFKKNIPYVKVEETPNETRFYLKENQLNEAVRCKAIFNTPQNELVPFIKTLTQFMDENIDIRPLPKVRFVDDEANASKVLGKTAYYDPQNCAITLYITDRHPKDILRSFAHEMIHHMQNMQGRLGNISTQNINQDDNLKGLEEEAYQLGNIMLRSWENSQDKINEIKVQPGKTGVVAPLTSEEKEWIKKQLRNFDPGDTPPEDPNTPLQYNFIDEGYIENKIEDEYMTSKDLEIFDSIRRKLKNKIYTFNIGHDNQVGNYPQLRDSVVKSDTYYISSLNIMWSDRDDNGVPFGAFDKNTGKYIKYSDLNEIKLQPFNTGVGSKLRVTFTLDPSYFFYPKDIKSIDDVNERHFGGWINSKGLPKMQGDLYRNDSSNVILSIIKTNTNTPHEHLKAWEDKLDSLKIPYKDKLLTQNNKFGITDIDANKYLVLNIGQPTNEIKVKPGKTGVVGALTSEEKEWIGNQVYNIDRDYLPNNTDSDTPLEYAFIDRKGIEDDIKKEYMTFKDLELFDSIYRKLKNKIYAFNHGHDPKIKKYPEDYDLRDAVVRADFENNNPELTITISDRLDGSYGSELGAFDKDTGEYLKYSDLDKIGKIV